MPIYEGINCPFQVGDVVRGRPMPERGPWGWFHHQVPTELMRVIELRYCHEWGQYNDVNMRLMPYHLKAVSLSTGKPILEYTNSEGWIWAGFLVCDPFMTAVARANT